jgi:hypothetical protein
MNSFSPNQAHLTIKWDMTKLTGTPCSKELERFKKSWTFNA